MEKDEEIKLDQEIKELVCDTWEYELKDIEGRKIVIGIAIMDLKCHTKTMSAIIGKLKAFEEFIIVVINQDTMLNMPAEKWPQCDCLLSFFSTGFPFARAIRYCKLRKPIMINNLFYQRLLWDRRVIYTILEKNKIPVAPHIFISRDGQDSANNDENAYYTPEERADKLKWEEGYRLRLKAFILKYEHNSLPKLSDDELKDCTKDSTSISSDKLIIEVDDYIVANKIKVTKPFLEKPINGEDHNIYIYYPLSSGGGSKRLFRKKENESSKFYPKENCTRTNSSFIYEKFLTNDGFDIKVYTVGTSYAHAEARKSPTLDGKVQRQLDGKEIRYPVLMSPEEKEIARKITIIFKQQICGFDFLRSNGASHVCDVNGWSFVKGNEAYYNDCAWEIRKIILSQIGKQHLKMLPPHTFKSESAISTPSTSQLRPTIKLENAKLELRSVVAIFRHGDRTPKQKMKLIVTEQEFLIFFKECKKSSDPYGPIKLKTPKHLQLLLDNTDKLLNGMNLEGHEMDRIGKLSQLKNVLSRGGHFDGINRKVQLKPTKTVEVNGVVEVEQALLILKWGGELTHSGIEQAEHFGKWFRETVYPYSENGGLLRLHSTYRHDLKCYSSDEGRCQLSAAAFLKGMLALEGELSPILTLVTSNESSIKMLDECEGASSEMKDIKKKLMTMMNSSIPMISQFSELEIKQINLKVINHIKELNNPISTLQEIHSLIKDIVIELEKLLSITYKSESYLISKPVKEHMNSYLELEDIYKSLKCNAHKKSKDLLSDPCILNYDEVSSEIENRLMELHDDEKEKVCGCGQENLVLMYKRWKKLEKDFYMKKAKSYDSSKIPDVYDCIKYDMIHNPLLINSSKIQLFKKIQAFNSIITPLEYGITKKDKISIGYNIVSNLIHKIRHDLLWWLDSKVRTEFKGFSNEANFGMLDGKIMAGVVNSTWRFVRTRLYFTSASHLYSFFNLLCNGMCSLRPLISPKAMQEFQTVNELSYLSYIVFRLYEDLNVDPNDPKRFRLQLGMSPGCIGDPLLSPNKNHIIDLAPEIDLSSELTLDEIMKFLDSLCRIETINKDC